MQRKVPTPKKTCIDLEVIQSQAFWDLTGISLKVYIIFLMKRVFSNTSLRKRKEKVVVNNGEITYTFKEACKNHKIPKSTFLRARDQLIKVGLIEIAEYGGNHHTNKYTISQNWKNYPEQTFERPKSGNLVGMKTRWTSNKNV